MKNLWTEWWEVRICRKREVKMLRHGNRNIYTPALNSGQLQSLCPPPSHFRVWSTSHEYKMIWCLSNCLYTVHHMTWNWELLLMSSEERLEMSFFKYLMRILYHEQVAVILYLSYEAQSHFCPCLMADCSCTKFLREVFELFRMHIYILSAVKCSFQSILSDYLPLRVGVKLGNSVLICFIVLVVLQENCYILWTTARDEEVKIVLPSSYVLGCIWIIFIPNNILIAWW